FDAGLPFVPSPAKWVRCPVHEPDPQRVGRRAGELHKIGELAVNRVEQIAGLDLVEGRVATQHAFLRTHLRESLPVERGIAVRVGGEQHTLIARHGAALSYAKEYLPQRQVGDRVSILPPLLCASVVFEALPPGLVVDYGELERRDALYCVEL